MIFVQFYNQFLWRLSSANNYLCIMMHNFACVSHMIHKLNWDKVFKIWHWTDLVRKNLTENVWNLNNSIRLWWYFLSMKLLGVTTLFELCKKNAFNRSTNDIINHYWMQVYTRVLPSLRFECNILVLTL